MSVGKSVTMRLVWGAGVLAVLAGGCREDLTAPGICPEYCPAKIIEVFDSLFVGSISRDSAYAGYVAAYEAERAQVISDGAANESRVIVRFNPFSAEFNNQPIAQIDSFRLRVDVIRRSDWPGMELAVHRLPPDIDSTTTHADLVAFFDDSTEIAVLVLPDTLESDTISVLLPGDAFPELIADSMVAAVGFRMTSGPEGYVDLGTREAAFPPVMTMYVQYTSDEGPVEVSEQRVVQFDSFVAVDPPPFGPNVLGVGGAPSWRSFLRFDLPSYITDSSDIARATLILVPFEPISGAATDTLRLRADALIGDVGSKSPILAPARELWDTLSTGGLNLVPGERDTVRIDVTHILKPLRADSTRPRAIVLWMVPEAVSPAQARFWSSRNAPNAPALFVTYTPLFPRNEP